MKRRGYRKTKRATGRRKKSYGLKRKRGFKAARTYKPSRGGIRL